MDVEEFRLFCLGLDEKNVSEEFPFDSNTLVFKIGGKMFALCDVDRFRSVNLKCDPEWAVELREQFNGILPGYHMNKKHWNTVQMDGSIPNKLLIEMITHSFDLVIKSLPKKRRESL
ncbi:MAG: putative DNA-binding protein (MmcQ/YjbR family) [Bacteroidia bacterium]|jgi:predicted DNA-binding protein (MmcQ/YjbR family)